MTPPSLPSWLADAHRTPLVMGILNITPDSFSDGGRFDSPDAALAQAELMVADGADWIDIGAESTRPGSSSIPADEQLQRLSPIFASLRKRVPIVLSIDTTQAAVAEAALDAGVDVINDISAGRDDPAMFSLAARRRTPIILMHMQGNPATMQQNPQYRNVTTEVADFLGARMAAAESAGIERKNILLDPGIGFGKTLDHNLQLLRELPTLAAIGQPLVVGTSRKGFIEKITGESAGTGRPFGTAATIAWSIANGAAIVRVHDIAPMKRIVQMIRAISSPATNAP